jgi:deoxyribonuclease-2
MTIMTMGSRVVLLLQILLATPRLLVVSSSIGCLDENGDAVDSWVSLAQNADYQYYWHNATVGFVKSEYDLNQTTDGCIMSTVNQLYASDLNMSNIAYAMYNDDPPPPYGTASSTYAHSKGVLLFDDEQGFWLVHSKPNWPNSVANGAVGFPDTTYAQSLMCITLNTETFETIAKTNMVNYPYLYDSFVSSNLITAVPSFDEWINGGKSVEDNMTSTFVSAGGVPYTQFAKSKAWGKDLYEDLVAVGLNQSLNVETWRLGSGGR